MFFGKTRPAHDLHIFSPSVPMTPKYPLTQTSQSPVEFIVLVAMPSGQDSQAEFPELDVISNGHDSHETASIGEIWPAEQDKHAVAWTGEFAYIPALHDLHEALLLLEVYLPCSHEVQLVSPASMYRPARQGTHPVAATTVLAVPAAVAATVALDVGVYWPAGHDTQLVLFTLGNKLATRPISQDRQLDVHH